MLSLRIPRSRLALSETDRAFLPARLLRPPLPRIRRTTSSRARRSGPVLVLVPGLSVPYSTWDRNVARSRLARAIACSATSTTAGAIRIRPRADYHLDLYAGAAGRAPERPSVIAEARRPRRPFHGRSSRRRGSDAPSPAWPAGRGPYRPPLRMAQARPFLARWPSERPHPRRCPHGALRGEGHPRCGAARRLLRRAPPTEDFMPELPAATSLSRTCSARRSGGRLRSIPGWPLKAHLRRAGELGTCLLLLFWGREDATLPFEQSARLARASLLRGLNSFAVSRGRAMSRTGKNPKR